MLTGFLVAASGASIVVGVALDTPEGRAVADQITLRWITDVLTRQGVWQVAAVVLALFALMTLRRMLFARLARRPGPVEIVAFGGAAENGAGEEVLADFRRTLTEMSIATPLSVPTAVPADHFLDDVRTALHESANAVATAAGIVRALVQIRHAYRVGAQLRQREGDKPFGMTVHVEVRPAGTGETATFWGEDWSEVAERAAHFVGAFVLPRSRLARRSPWTAWRGLKVPPELFHLSQRAHRLLKERRYEESLRAFHETLKIDPANPYLRIGMGQVQEFLGLHLDALATYADVVGVEAWYDRRLWNRLRLLLQDEGAGRPPSPFARSPNGREALLIARYRLVCRLAAAEQLGDQWWRGGPRAKADEDQDRNTRRQTERAALRMRLSVWLRAYLRLYLRLGRRLPGRVAGLVEPDRLEYLDLRHFLQFVAYCEAMYLVHDYRWMSGRRTPGMPVTQTALNLMRIWAPLVLDHATARRDWSDGLPVENWPRGFEELDARIQLYLRRKPRWAREWQEYYNAACTFAVALGPLDLLDPEAPTEGDAERSLARHAVRHLERAVTAADSGYVANFAQWLSTGDQDLNHLRATEVFVDFLDRYLPNQESRQQRPRTELLRLIMSLHVPRLLKEYASRRADFWQACTEPDADLGTIIDELDREFEVRQLVGEFARHDRDWLSRIGLVDEARAFARRHGMPEFPAAFPYFQHDPMIQEQARSGRGPGEVTEVRDARGEVRVSGTYPDAFVEDVIRWRRERWRTVAAIFESPAAPVFRRESSASVLREGVLPALRFWDRVAAAAAEVLLPGSGESRQSDRGEVWLVGTAIRHDWNRFAPRAPSSGAQPPSR